jgi:paraquat-inducible protein A
VPFCLAFDPGSQIAILVHEKASRMKAGLIACKVCAQVHELKEDLQPGLEADCARCGSRLARKTPGSRQLTAAFALCALLLYAPANLFPILRMSMYGRISENTIFSGIVRFYQDGDYFVAIVVFLASILIPFLKILGLFTLVISTHFQWERGQNFRTKLFLTIETLGRWAMLDVFALAILISLVKLERLAMVIPGKGALAFVLVILFTILASSSFDPQLIWEKEEAK